MDLSKLLTSSGTVNSAILRRSWFQTSDQLKEILLKTSQLDVFPGVSISDRIYFLLGQATLTNCRICGKPRIVFKHSQHHFSLCNHKQKLGGVKGANHKITQDRSHHLREFVSRIPRPQLSDTVFQEHLSAIPERLNYHFTITDNNVDFLHDLVLKTDFLLPLSDHEFQFAQRWYLARNNIGEVPKCKFCGGPVSFINRFEGYRSCCKNCRNKLGSETRSLNTNSVIEQLIDREKYEIVSLPGLVNNNPLVVRCKTCGKESEWMLHNGKIGQLKYKPLCRHCESCISQPEEELKDFCRSLLKDSLIVENDRKAVAPKELDIYVPKLRVAIEYNGLYWHSDGCGYVDSSENRTRHKVKTDLCEKRSIRLIQVFEDEWECKQDVVKSRIASILGKFKKRVYARNCIVKELGVKECKEFLGENHLQGNSNAGVRLGLFCTNELVSVMTFCKPRFSKKYDWELARFCNKLNYQVVGGASKLLAHFERTYHPKSLLSYADRRWSIGDVYEKLGFTLDHISAPDYWYVVSGTRESRVKYQKHNLPKLLGEKFDPNLSESQNMKNAGYWKVYDCGNLVYVKNYKTK